MEKQPFASIFRATVADRGQIHVADAIGMSKSSFGRRFNDEDGWSLEEIDKACAAVGLELRQAGPDTVTISKRKYQELLAVSVAVKERELEELRRAMGAAG